VLAKPWILKVWGWGEGREGEMRDEIYRQSFKEEGKDRWETPTGKYV
jgi:hypothetical protein